jgi:hypothetical protein
MHALLATRADPDNDDPILAEAVLQHSSAGVLGEPRRQFLARELWRLSGGSVGRRSLANRRLKRCLLGGEGFEQGAQVVC